MGLLASQILERATNEDDEDVDDGQLAEPGSGSGGQLTHGRSGDEDLFSVDDMRGELDRLKADLEDAKPRKPALDKTGKTARKGCLVRKHCLSSQETNLCLSLRCRRRLPPASDRARAPGGVSARHVSVPQPASSRLVAAEIGRRIAECGCRAR